MAKKFTLRIDSTCNCLRDCDCSRYPDYVLLVDGKRGYGCGGYGISSKTGKDIFSGSFLGVELSGDTITDVASKLSWIINNCRDQDDHVQVEIR